MVLKDRLRDKLGGRTYTGWSHSVVVYKEIKQGNSIKQRWTLALDKTKFTKH